ncbi:MAG: phosphoserine phosphatase [Thermoproteota archaeon]|nr:MAG: phosphoserine phosphatase [Candidatus Korarchaeota archaeon]
MRIRAVAFDMDGTLTKEESSWALLHDAFGADPAKVEENRRLYEQGVISYLEWARLDIALWGKGGKLPHILDVIDALDKVELADGARELFRELRARGIATAIVTSGIDLLAARVARELQADLWIGNGLVVDEEGYLTGECILRVDPLRKHMALRMASSLLSVPLEEFAAVGDTRYDLSMMKEAGLKVAYRPKHPELEAEVDIVLEGSLAELLKHI